VGAGALVVAEPVAVAGAVAATSDEGVATDAVATTTPWAAGGPAAFSSPPSRLCSRRLKYQRNPAVMPPKKTKSTTAVTTGALPG
jgi:hypothetical protein